MKATDIRIVDVAYSYEDFNYRTPIKFGGVALDRVTILNVNLTVQSAAGKTARGFGSMPMGNVWAFPSKTLTYDQTLGAMKAVVERIARILRSCTTSGHPIDLSWALEHEFIKAAAAVDGELKLADKIPILCTLVSASPFDAALHDAFGKLHGLNCYHTYGPEFMNHDVGYFLGDAFKGESLDRYVSKTPKAKMPLYHLVGALDPLEDKDIVKRVNDGLPETLGEWIRADGLTHLKIKLNGDNLNWDVERVLGVDRIASEPPASAGG